MKDFPNFFLRNDEDIKPYEAAVEWLIAQRLQPEDEIKQNDITVALGMIDPDTLRSRALIQRWQLVRMPQVEMMILEFEERSGLVLMPTHRGTYVVLEPDEVAETVMTVMQRRIRNALRMCAGKIARASRETASDAELQRRSQVTQYVNNVREFMSRKRRPSLDDEMVS